MKCYSLFLTVQLKITLWHAKINTSFWHYYTGNLDLVITFINWFPSRNINKTSSNFIRKWEIEANKNVVNWNNSRLFFSWRFLSRAWIQTNSTRKDILIPLQQIWFDKRRARKRKSTPIGAAFNLLYLGSCWRKAYFDILRWSVTHR